MIGAIFGDDPDDDTTEVAAEASTTTTAPQTTQPPETTEVAVATTETTEPRATSAAPTTTTTTGVATTTEVPTTTAAPTTTQQPQGVVVPDLVGLELPDAYDVADEADLDLDPSDAREDRSIIRRSNWTVKSQDPSAGDRVADGSTVRVGVVNDRDSAPSEGSRTDTLDELAATVESNLELLEDPLRFYGIEWSEAGSVIQARIQENDEQIGQAMCGSIVSSTYSVPGAVDRWDDVEVRGIGGGNIATCEINEGVGR